MTDRINKGFLLLIEQCTYFVIYIDEAHMLKMVEGIVDKKGHGKSYG